MACAAAIFQVLAQVSFGSLLNDIVIANNDRLILINVVSVWLYVCLLLLLPHPFPLLCGIDVSYDTPLFSPVLYVLPWQSPLRQVVPNVVHPPPFRSSSLYFPRHFHHQHSLPYLFVFSSQDMPIPLQHTFLHLLGYFSHPRFPSNSFIHNSVQLGDSTHPS